MTKKLKAIILYDFSCSRLENVLCFVACVWPGRKEPSVIYMATCSTGGWAQRCWSLIN